MKLVNKISINPMKNYDIEVEETNCFFVNNILVHNSNGGICRTASGKIMPQSREQILSIGNDNAGFAAFCEANNDHIVKLFDVFPANVDVTIYGEWVGGNIQKGVALTGLDKHFVMFKAKIGDGYVNLPTDLHNNDNGIYNIDQIPSYEVEIDFLNPTPVSEVLADLTLKVEEECPWAKIMFGVSGVGEGIVWHQTDNPELNDYWFKTKGVKHKGGGKPQKIKISDEKLESINAAAEEVLPEWRLEQGIAYLRENNIPLIPQSTGDYLRWIAGDILKEETGAIEASGFTWKEIQNPAIRNAKNYFLNHINTNFDAL